GAPLFVPATTLPQHRLRQFERDNLLADPSDRVNSRNTFSFGIANRLYRHGRLRGTLNLAFDRHLVGKGTTYSVTERDDDFSRLVVAGETAGLYRVNSRFNLTFDPKRERVEEGHFSLAVVPWSWVVLSAGYRYRAPIPANTARYFSQINSDDPWDQSTPALSQIRPGITLNLGSRLKLRYSASYDFDETHLQSQVGAFEYRSKCKCWAIGLDVQNIRRRVGEKIKNEISFQLRYSLLGAGDDSLRAGAFANTRSRRDF
ncbi:MAG: LPS assembly protein LptD, partial [Myxococcales bacterium]|nr:LPS assembly protein LptD [Myxococcales bacterium]